MRLFIKAHLGSVEHTVRRGYGETSDALLDFAIVRIITRYYSLTALKGDIAALFVAEKTEAPEA